MDIKPVAFSPLYPWAFIIAINSLDSPDNMSRNNALYPWGTSVGKDKLGLGHSAVRRAWVHNGSPVPSSNMKGIQSRSISLSSKYIWSNFLLDLIWQLSAHRQMYCTYCMKTCVVLVSIPRAACLLCELMHDATRRLRYKSAMPMKQSSTFCASNGKPSFQDVLHRLLWDERGLAYICNNPELPMCWLCDFCHLHNTQSWKCPLLLWRLLANIHWNSDCYCNKSPKYQTNN